MIHSDPLSVSENHFTKKMEIKKGGLILSPRHPVASSTSSTINHSDLCLISGLLLPGVKTTSLKLEYFVVLSSRASIVWSSYILDPFQNHISASSSSVYIVSNIPFW